MNDLDKFCDDIHRRLLAMDEKKIARDPMLVLRRETAIVAWMWALGRRRAQLQAAAQEFRERVRQRVRERRSKCDV